MKDTYVQVYTGDGKGKTTAAIGLAIRAIGAGLDVLFLQFMKSKVYSEHAVLPKLEHLTVETVGKPFFIIPEGMKSDEELAKWGDDVVVFPKGQPPASYVALIRKGFERALAAVASGDYDLIVLDEYNMALFFGLIDREATERLLAARNPRTELVFTGRGAPDWLMEAADLVTEMKECKHYYTKGVTARLGIEN
ncbi:cob(I)yrinic acid a,c-diamide adenosyltransferase [Veillonella magna]|uniref:cob(I)yrinic acid a,c-diamide adenosyltransferase n=1 Tax=Veillonella magna TaxID=464322 RepID=UPI00041A1158|nr:cob(I)yrinic acid a,c-diamide adenosyltransferase [Veillonella magna]MBD8975299.1 cob(I)yrinic acid a,c-diamide adenosyltransferase [Veillonella magna]